LSINSRAWIKKFAGSPAKVSLLFVNDHIKGKHNVVSYLFEFYPKNERWQKGIPKMSLKMY
jgi:basic membrane lipoprotein Med (substrate-binding protein (PBP1-ABC) superfamily)